MPKSNRTYSKIYLDHASATSIDQGVLKLMNQVYKENFANPSAIHDLGVKSKNILENARAKVARILGAHTDEIVFTSGATEANNLALLGVISGAKHVVTTNIEHASILEMCKFLERNKKIEVTYVGVEENGIVDPQKIKKALRPDTSLVSVMYANNEIGTIQPIKEIAKVIRHYKKLNPTSKVLFHTDSAQAVNYLDINPTRLGVDMMTLGSGKVYGPKGVGMLYVKRGGALSPIIYGGDQESNRRAGTENVAGVVGFAHALEIVEKIKIKESARLQKLRDYFINRLSHSNILTNDGMILNGDAIDRLANNVNITIPKIPSDLLVIELSAKGIYASEKSACKSGDKKTSHVISAIRPDELDGSLRFSLGRDTTKQDIDFTLKALQSILTKLKKWYN